MAHHTILIGIALAFAVVLVAAWVAALSAPDGPAEPSSLDHADGVGGRDSGLSLDAWDNGRAHYVGANCCGAEVVTTVHGWTLCAEHDLAA